MQPDRDLALTQTAAAEDGLDPLPEAPTRAAAALSMETAVSPLGPLSGPASRDVVVLQAGSTLKHYEIIRKLGQGGMGTVFLARDTKLGRLVAIKVLLKHSGQSAARFLAEAQATASCKHENIVVIHEVDELGGTPYMVLEYIEGRTLRAVLAQRGYPTSPELPEGKSPPSGRMAPDVAVELMIPVVRALDCAHQLGIVHRDLKPENILLTDAGRVVVLDFGIAKRLEAGEISMIAASDVAPEKGTGLTQEGALMGTLPYMSPEQWRSEDIDPRSDLWAVGIMLYELCTGAHPLSPFTAFDLAQVGELDEPMPSVRAKRKDLGALASIIDGCLKKRKAERIGSAQALLAGLKPFLPGRRALEVTGDQSPFASLSAFQEADAGRFFGRTRDVVSLLARLRSQPLVVVAGPSGAGKSSFVRAGVIPALKRSGDRWEAFILRPGRRPLAALADVLAQLPEGAGEGVQPSAPLASDPDGLAAFLRTQPGLLSARLRARCRKLEGRHRILLFVDQLEELYTLGTDPAERAAFVACLEGAADDASSPLRVLLSIRSDFLHRIAEDRRFMAEVTRGLCFLSPMGREGLREALTRPIEAAGHRFESEDMIEGMLSALECSQSPLPLLQFTAAKLWEARDREHRLLTQDSYAKLGGVAGALSTHADAVVAGLSSVERQLCRAVFLRLCTPERTRAVVGIEELHALADDSGAVEQVIHRLSDARLLLIETGGERGGTTVELTHESLIDRWPKLEQWLEESAQDAHFLDRLRVASEQWEKSEQAEGLLWRDRAAQDARAWLDRLRAEQSAGGAGSRLGIGKREARYLSAVVAFLERARRLRRRIAVGVFAALGAVALMVSYLAVRAGREAAHARAEAARADQEASQVRAQKTETEREAVRARNATRMAAAREMQSDPTSALALLREIEPPEVPRGWSRLVGVALQSGTASMVRSYGGTIVYSAAWSPDGKRIVVALNDGTAQVQSADGTGEPLVLRGHQTWIWTAAFSPDGKRIVTASGDKTARVWNADGSGEPLVLRGHEDQVSTATWSPDGKRIVTASDDKTARVWNADGSGRPLVLRGHQATIISAAFSPDGKRIVTASRDKTARVWNSDGTGEPRELRGHLDQVYVAAFGPDGTRIVTGSKDKTVRVWNADGSGEPLVLAGHEDTIHSAAFSPDGQRIVTSSKDRTARVWNADGSGEPIVLRGHEHWVYTAAWSPDGARIVTASLDKTVRVWSLDTLQRPRVLRGHEEPVHGVAWAPDGRRIVTSSTDKTARVWNADGSGSPLVLRGHEEFITRVAFSPDGKHILTASADKTARVWSADGSGAPLILRGHEAGVNSATWSPNGQRIVTVSEDRTARVWSADGSGEPLVLRGHEDRINWAAWSPDGEHILTASADKTARMWNADGSGAPLVLRGHEAGVEGAAWSPDGRRIVTMSGEKTARVWSADGSGEPLVLHGHEDRINWAAWSPDGEHILTTSDDKTARIWNADGSGQALVLRGHEARVGWADWSSDGKHIVTLSSDKTARVWNADGSGEPLVLSGNQMEVNWAAWSPDGKHIATTSDDKMVRVWTDLTPLKGTDDPRLWTATTHCLSIERRIHLLSVSEATAQADQQACQRRVEEARAAATARQPP